MVFHIVMHHICSMVLGRLKYVFFFLRIPVLNYCIFLQMPNNAL